jgi:periplasmic protein TonB
MFEDSLFASRVGVVSATKRWTVAASVAVQMALAGVVITLPLLHPEALPMHVDAPKVLMPVVPKPPVPVVVTEHVAPASTLSLPSAPSLPRPAIPTMLPGADTSASDVPGISSINIGMSDGASLPPGIGTGVGHGPDVSVAPARQSGPLHISTGVSEGMLLAPIRPVYPAIARTAGIQGTVVVEAVISRASSIESLRVVSGPRMLQNAALEAIRAAKYKPYKLNGEPVEVQTTITVNFRING